MSVDQASRLSLDCPFPASMDIHAAEKADRHILSWADSIRIFQGQRAELERFKIGTFAALTHSGFASSDHLLFAAKNIAALMSIDDHYCDEEVEGALPELAVARLAGLLPFLEEPQSIPPGQFDGSDREAEDPVALAVRDVMHHAALLGSPAQVGRLRREYVAMCLAMARESVYRVARRTPTLGEYVSQRPFNGAMACLAAIDIAGGFELGACEYDRPAVRGLTLLASSLILLVNDLYSGHKESVTHARTTNLPTLLCLNSELNLEDAVDKVVHLHNQQMRTYLKMEQDVASDASPELSRYLTGLRQWIGGSLEWHTMTGRYHEREGRPSAPSRPSSPQ